MIKGCLRIVLTAIAALVMAVVLVNGAVLLSTHGDIKTIEELQAEETNYDCIVVLGASVWGDGELSDILRDRVDHGIAAYNAGLADSIIMSGLCESGPDWAYDEPSAMKSYAVSEGIPPHVIYRDGAGYTTYDSMWRTAHVFEADRVVVVTQAYHLPRALFSLKVMGVDAVGIASDTGTYDEQTKYSLREIPGRVKDFLLAVLRQTAENPDESIIL